MGWEGSCRQSSRMERSHRKEQITRGKNPLDNAYGAAQEYSVLLRLCNPSELYPYPFFPAFPSPHIRPWDRQHWEICLPSKKEEEKKRKKKNSQGRDKAQFSWPWCLTQIMLWEVHLEGSVWQPQGKIQYELGPAGKLPTSQLEMDLILSVWVYFISCFLFLSMKHLFLSLL